MKQKAKLIITIIAIILILLLLSVGIWAVYAAQSRINGIVSVSSDIEAIISAKVYGHATENATEENAQLIGEYVFEGNAEDGLTKDWTNLNYNFVDKSKDIVIVVAITNTSADNDIIVTINNAGMPDNSNVTCVVSKSEGGEAVTNDVITKKTGEEYFCEKYYITLHIVNRNHSVNQAQFNVSFALESLVVEP